MPAWRGGSLAGLPRSSLVKGRRPRAGDLVRCAACGRPCRLETSVVVSGRRYGPDCAVAARDAARRASELPPVRGYAREV